MAGKVWTVQFERTHVVELAHGTKSGSRSVIVDGVALDLGDEKKQFIDRGSVHRFQVEGRPVEVHIEPVGFGRWHYRLSADGEWLDPPLPARKLPIWSFAFVALACLPAIQIIRANDSPLAMLLCGSLAIGATFGIIANARDPLLSVERKLVKCGFLAALVWGVIAIPSILMLGAVRLLNG